MNEANIHTPWWANRITELEKNIALLEKANREIGKNLLDHSDEVNRRGDRIVELKLALQGAITALQFADHPEGPMVHFRDLVQQLTCVLKGETCKS